MSQNRFLKLKSENNKKVKFIFVPLTYNELLEKINSEFLPNYNDPNKVYQIYDTKFEKLIKDENDYKIFNLQHYSDNKILLLVNLIDKADINKIPEYLPESSSLFFQSQIIPKQNEEEKEEIKIEKELTEEEKIKENIRLLVQSKLKLLENNIIKDIKEKIHPVHNGIICNECGVNNIKGIRYKCSICPNYNLCEKCEENSEHAETHVFLKIPQPYLNENELNQKINESKLSYSKILLKEKGVNYDYISEPKIFHFKKDNLINVQNVTLKNNGNMVWKKGFKFILVKKYSNYYGNDFDFLKDVNPGDSINIELAFDESIGSEQNEYFCSYKLIDEESNQIGNIQKFEIKMI